MNILYTSMYALSCVKDAYGEESNKVMWLVWKSGHYGQNGPSRNWTSGQILPSIIFWFASQVTAELPEMNARLRLNFQIPKYLETENSRSEPVSQLDAPCCRVFLVTCFLISKEGQSQSRAQGWFCTQCWMHWQWMLCVCIPWTRAFAREQRCQRENVKTILPLFFLSPVPHWCKRSCYNSKSKFGSGVLSRG